MKKIQQGLTLIEMMIAMLIGIMLIGSVLTMFVTNVRSNSDNVAMIRLNQELRSVMGFMSDELKRAGYSGDSGVDDFNDDYALSANCLRYSYDEDNDGTRDGNERFGFKAVDSDADGSTDTIQWANNNTAADCSAGTWQGITEPTIANITSVVIASGNIVIDSVTVRQLTITITATKEISGGVTTSRTISEVIRLRNDATS